MDKAKRRSLTKKQYALKWFEQGGKCGISKVKMTLDDNIHEDHIVEIWKANEEGKIHWWPTDEWIDVNDPRNIQLVLSSEHLKKTKKDTSSAAKHKRLTGQTKTGPKAKINSPGFKTNRESPWKKKINNSVERRER